MKNEIYEDVLKEEPKDEKEIDKWEKRLHKSVGWVDPLTRGTVLTKENKDGKLVPNSDVLEEGEAWDVVVGDGEAYTCDTQTEAELLSYLVQVNERLKRIENEINKLRKSNS